VVAVRDGGAESTLVGEAPLVLAESEGAEALAAATRKALALHEGQRERRERRERIVSHFSSDSMCHQLLKLYERLAADGSVNEGGGEAVAGEGKIPGAPVPA
jgi:glycosyltransferase involved in cell wall biosynthesis